MDPNVCDYGGFTPLILATYEDHFRVMLALVSCDRVNVNFKDDFGNTALHYATYRASIRSAEILLGREETDITVENKEGQSYKTGGNPWIGLSRCNVYPSWNNVNSKDRRGAKPLIIAIKSKNTSIARKLLSMETVDVDAEDDQGMTPLR